MDAQDDTFSHWEIATTLTFKQATMLWAGQDPANSLVKDAKYKAVWVTLSKAFFNKELLGIAVPSDDYLDGYALALLKHEGPDVSDLSDDSNIECCLDDTLFKRRDLAIWARARDQAPGFLLRDLEKLAKETEAATSQRELTITERYTTRLMDLMFEAVETFWQNHDPKNPPKSKEVIDWLVLRIDKGSVRTATAIDLIIRSDKSKLGGKPKVAVLDYADE